MAAIEDGQEAGAVGQLAVVLLEVLVGEGVLGLPVEVHRHQGFVAALGLAVGAVAGQLRTVAGVEEHALIVGPHAIGQPVQALQQAGAGGARIGQHANVIGLEAAFLQQRAHQIDVVDAAVQAHVGLWIFVDAHQQRAPPHAPGHGQRRGRPRTWTDGGLGQQARQDVAGHARLRQVGGAIVVDGRSQKALGDGVGARVVAGQRAREDHVLRVVELEPLADALALGVVQRLDAAAQGRAQGRMSELRAEAEQPAAAQQRPLAGGHHAPEQVIAAQAAQVVRAHQLRPEVLVLLAQGGHQRIAQRRAFRPFQGHAGRPAHLLVDRFRQAGVVQGGCGPRGLEAQPGQGARHRPGVERVVVKQRVVAREAVLQRALVACLARAGLEGVLPLLAPQCLGGLVAMDAAVNHPHAQRRRIGRRGRLVLCRRHAGRRRGLCQRALALGGQGLGVRLGVQALLDLVQRAAHGVGRQGRVRQQGAADGIGFGDAQLVRQVLHHPGQRLLVVVGGRGVQCQGAGRAHRACRQGGGRVQAR